MIDSVIEEKSETDEFQKLYMESLIGIEEEKIVKGKIIRITPEEVTIDIGYKSEGAIKSSEFRNIKDLKVGDTIDVFLEKKEDAHGMVVLSKQKAEKIMGWESILSQCKEGEVIEGRVARKVKGGLIVDIGMDAFLPASQVDVKPLRDVNLDNYIGQAYKFRIIKISQERKNVILSRRELLEEQLKKGKSQLLEVIKPGDVRVGRIKNITDFGAFVDLSGIDGLLHITDITWGRINHPTEVLAIGDELEVCILDVDREKERLSLGLKQLFPNPWEKADEKYPVGTKIKGKVVNIMPYGAFLEIEKGLEGLIHISEISWNKRITNPADVLSLGDEIDAMVLDLDVENKKLSLGIKQIEANPWDHILEKYPVGSKVSGNIRNIANYGIFVEIEEGIDGLVHISDFSWTRKINHPTEIYKKGDQIEAVVLSVDTDNKKIALGIKQIAEDPWASIEDRYKIGQEIEGKITKITGFGAFIELEDGIEGLVHISQLTHREFSKVEDVVQEGSDAKAVIVKIDKDERRIGLSMKELETLETLEKQQKTKNK